MRLPECRQKIDGWTCGPNWNQTTASCEGDTGETIILLLFSPNALGKAFLCLPSATQGQVPQSHTPSCDAKTVVSKKIDWQNPLSIKISNSILD